MVAHLLPKQVVASSSLVSRSRTSTHCDLFLIADTMSTGMRVWYT